MADPDNKINPAADHMQRIQSSQSLQLVQSLQATGKSRPKPSAEAVTGTTGDRVQLSARAQELMSARKQIKAMGEVDEKKVAMIKEQLKNGTYRVDAQKAAANMLQESFIHQLK